MTASKTFRDVIVADGKLRLYPRLFSAAESDRYFNTLREEVDWKSERIAMFGKSVALPRLTAWYGDPGMRYSYSGISSTPIDWTPMLLDIKARVEEVSMSTFNSVLLNYYRNGRDSVSWHSDDEPELGRDAVIGSVSFGSERPFQLRRRAALKASQPPAERGQQRPRLTLSLASGSYLEMGAGMQQNWMHQLPKRPRLNDARINLTFRRVHPAP